MRRHGLDVISFSSDGSHTRDNIAYLIAVRFDMYLLEEDSLYFGGEVDG